MNWKIICNNYIKFHNNELSDNINGKWIFKIKTCYTVVSGKSNFLLVPNYITHTGKICHLYWVYICVCVGMLFCVCELYVFPRVCVCTHACSCVYTWFFVCLRTCLTSVCVCLRVPLYAYVSVLLLCIYLWNLDIMHKVN